MSKPVYGNPAWDDMGRSLVEATRGPLDKQWLENQNYETIDQLIQNYEAGLPRLQMQREILALKSAGGVRSSGQKIIDSSS